MAPVFHTKTIESILKPVAEQVSQLVIIHEEGESGIAIPDLSSQITAVTAAVVNLVDVAKQTCASSKDAILKEEMPVAYTKVEVSSTNLAESTQTLKKDPYSVDGRRMLLDGARGILSGTSSLLLTFDNAEVRKILAACRQVMDYLYVAEVVEGMADLVTFVKNLTPGITNMAKQVEGRIKDLTHATHRDLLTQHMTGLKEKVQNLIPALKNFVQCHTSGASADEARENRNFLITKMVDHIIEIMRVLQLKVENEYDLEDPTNMMRKARHALNEKIQAGKDWLDNPDAGPNGLGERALRDIIKQARLIGTMANDKGILDLCDRLESQIDKLADLRGKGLGSSPEALALAKEISNGLNKLQEMVDDAIRREASSGARLPATTTDDQFDQALEWIDGSDDPNGIGEFFSS
jgi:vinculin